MFTKDINYNPDLPAYIEVLEGTQHSIKANNNKWYLPEMYFNELQEGDYFVEHLPNHLFETPNIPQWNKQSYSEMLNQAHDDWFRNLYISPPYNYSDLSDILSYVGHPIYDLEAKSFIKLWHDSYDVLNLHLNSVTEETAMSVDDFIESLPNLDI